MSASTNALDPAKNEANILLPPNFNWTSPISAAAGVNILVVFDDGPQNANLNAVVSGIVKLDQQPNVSDPGANNYNLSQILEDRDQADYAGTTWHYETYSLAATTTFVPLINAQLLWYNKIGTELDADFVNNMAFTWMYFQKFICKYSVSTLPALAAEAGMDAGMDVDRIDRIVANGRFADDADIFARYLSK